jgi:hypothetical protein
MSRFSTAEHKTETANLMITPSTLSRRDFFQQSGRAVAASALAGITLPHVHAADSDTIQLAIIG